MKMLNEIENEKKKSWWNGFITATLIITSALTIITLILRVIESLNCG